MKPIFHHPIDAIPAGVITAGVLLALLPFMVKMPLPVLVMIWLASLAARSLAPVHQHCHAHRPLLRSRWANFLYDQILMLAAGNTTAVWEMQHVVGHHRSFLNPVGDPAAVDRFGKEGPLQRIVFTLAGDFLSISDSFRIAAEKPRARKRLLRLSIHLALQAAALIALLMINPRLAIIFVIVPEMILRWTIFWVSWSQHHGVPNDDVYSGAVTSFGWENLVWLNVGHHTAHHEKPTLHWARLPERTAQIRERLPAACLRGAA